MPGCFRRQSLASDARGRAIIASTATCRRPGCWADSSARRSRLARAGRGSADRSQSATARDRRSSTAAMRRRLSTAVARRRPTAIARAPVVEHGRYAGIALPRCGRCAVQPIRRAAHKEPCASYRRACKTFWPIGSLATDDVLRIRRAPIAGSSALARSAWTAAIGALAEYNRRDRQRACRAGLQGPHRRHRRRATFPRREHLANVICACRDAGVFWKATAGLHHPLAAFRRGPRRVSMHGFINC